MEVSCRAGRAFHGRCQRMAPVSMPVKDAARFSRSSAGQSADSTTRRSPRSEPQNQDGSPPAFDLTRHRHEEGRGRLCRTDRFRSTETLHVSSATGPIEPAQVRSSSPAQTQAVGRSKGVVVGVRYTMPDRAQASATAPALLAKPRPSCRSDRTRRRRTRVAPVGNASTRARFVWTRADRVHTNAGSQHLRIPESGWRECF